jgi:hypothetical protein
MTDLINIKKICADLISSHIGEDAANSVHVTEPRPWIVNIKYDDGKQGASVEVFVGEVKPADIKSAVLDGAMRTLCKALPKKAKRGRPAKQA